MAAPNIEIQERVTERLNTPGLLVAPVQFVQARPKELEAKINAALANHGLAGFVWMPMPKRFHHGPDIFFKNVEVRVRLVEEPLKNRTEFTCYDMVFSVIQALHWWHVPELLAHPLYTNEDCCEEGEEGNKRFVDVLFTAVFGLEPATEPEPTP